MVIFAAAFGVYIGNDECITSFDSAPTTLFAFNVLENHRFDYDAFRSSYFDRIGGGYAFVEAPNGHLTSVFPIGAALLTFPIFSGLYAVRIMRAGPPPILVPSFEDERHRDEKLAAAIIAAAAVVMCYFAARSYATPFAAGIATFGFGFGGEMWTIGAQGLWQHGPVNLVLLSAVFATLSANVNPDRHVRTWLAVAGLCAGSLPVIRPTAVLFTIAIAIFVMTAPRLRARALWFGLPAAVGLAPGLAWNAAFFHSFSGGYGADLQMYDFAPAHVSTALVGLFASPSRGWLIFSPIVVFSFAGILRAAREGTQPARLIVLLGSACGLLFLNYGLYGGWIGGHCFGPRFLTDASGVMALALPFVLPPSLGHLRRAGSGTTALAGLFVFALVLSTGVQFVGSYSGAAGPVWNAIPVDVAVEPARIWALKDNQIERNARGLFYRYAPVFPTAGGGYAAGFAGRVTRIADLTGPMAGILSSTVVTGQAGTAPLFTVSVHNVGTSRWYGYDTAVYNGEARVRASIETPQGAVISQQELYIAGTVSAGETAVARGLLALPAEPGDYRFTFDPISFARSDIPVRDAGRLQVVLRVRSPAQTGVSAELVHPEAPCNDPACRRGLR
jgi:hypothetical protein